jgi:multidrug efflux pump
LETRQLESFLYKLAETTSALIVEFAKILHTQGQDLLVATRNALRIRLRPIVMTSLAFSLGVFPLAVSSDAVSGAQNAVGIIVVSGVIVATVLGIFLTPLFFVMVIRLVNASQKKDLPLPSINASGAENSVATRLDVE